MRRSATGSSLPDAERQSKSTGQRASSDGKLDPATFGETEAAQYADLASSCYDSFNKRFWYDAGGYLYDVPEFCYAASSVRIFRRSSISNPSSSRRYSARLFRASSKISASSFSIWRVTSSIIRAILVSKLRSEGFIPFNS